MADGESQDSTKSDTCSIASARIAADQAVRMWEEEKTNANDLGVRENLILSGIAVLLGLGVFQLQWFRESEPAFRNHLLLWLTKGLLFAALSCFLFTFTGLFGKGFSPYVQTGHRVRAKAMRRTGEGVLRLLRNASVSFRRRAVNEPAPEAKAGFAWAKFWASVRTESRPSGDGYRRASHALDLGKEFIKDPPPELQALLLIGHAADEAYRLVRDRNARRADRLNRFQPWFLAGVYCNAAALVTYLLQV
jgi:hypothetical protein